jgi:hypothetical protein
MNTVRPAFQIRTRSAEHACRIKSAEIEIIVHIEDHPLQALDLFIHIAAEPLEVVDPESPTSPGRIYNPSFYAQSQFLDVAIFSTRDYRALAGQTIRYPDDANYDRFKDDPNILIENKWDDPPSCLYFERHENVTSLDLSIAAGHGAQFQVAATGITELNKQFSVSATASLARITTSAPDLGADRIDPDLAAKARARGIDRIMVESVPKRALDDFSRWFNPDEFTFSCAFETNSGRYTLTAIPKDLAAPTSA